MRTILSMLILLSSFVQGYSQETCKSKLVHPGLNTEHKTKMEFFEALIKKNNIDIKLKGNNSVATIKTKTDFYKVLIMKNGFLLYETQLSDITPKEEHKLPKSEREITTINMLITDF